MILTFLLLLGSQEPSN